MCVFFFSSKNKLLDSFGVPLLFSCEVCCSGKQTSGVPPSGVTVGQPVVVIEGVSSTARWSEFKCSFLYLLFDLESLLVSVLQFPHLWNGEKIVPTS